MSKKVYFYDPHPGFRGALVPLPYSIKEIADEINGKTLDLEEVIEKMELTAFSFNGEVTAVSDKKPKFIKLVFTRGSYKHCFCVIRYRERK